MKNPYVDVDVDVDVVLPPDLALLHKHPRRSTALLPHLAQAIAGIKLILVIS